MWSRLQVRTWAPEFWGAFSFPWSAEAKGAFAKLKVLFTTALVLTHPDSEHQFTAEVGASDVGMGAVLSQKRGVSEAAYLCPLKPPPDPRGEELRCRKPWSIDPVHHPLIIRTWPTCGAWSNWTPGRHGQPHITSASWWPSDPATILWWPWTHIALNFITRLPLRRVTW